MKNFTLLLTLILSLSAGLLLAQPANDNVCGAIALAANGGCTNGTLASSTASPQGTPSCWLTAPSTDVWYYFVATSTTMSVSTDYAGDGSGDLTDSQLAVYSSSNNTCSGTLTQVGCDEDGGTTVALNSEVNMTGLTIGNTYYVRVDGFNTSTGDFCVGAFNTPAATEVIGSTCQNATVVYPNNAACSAANGNVSYNSTLGWTPAVGVNYCGCDNETSQQGGWSTFTANATSTTITNMTAGGNQEPLDFTVFTGGCSGLSCVACYSVAKGGAQTVTTTIGTQYWVLTTLQAGSTNEFRPDICITSSVACTPPANNNCAGAIAITANTTYTISDYCATPDQSLCSGSTENNIWYTWTVPATWSGNTYFQITNQNCTSGYTSGGTQVSIYTANATCATASGCVVYSNSGSDEDISIGWTPVAGATYLINFDGQAGEVCTLNFGITNIVAPLPIELLSFNALKLDRTVMLQWETATETNNDYFTIERTRNGRDFEVVGTVDGSGTTPQGKEYSLIDNAPYDGLSYYRLKQTDFDGKSTIFDLKAVEFATAHNGLSFDLIPNPAGSDQVYVNLEGISDSEVSVNVFDVAGKLVYSKAIMLSSSGTAALELNNLLSSGLYMVRVADAQNVQTKKLAIR
jgi:hypothetical protein